MGGINYAQPEPVKKLSELAKYELINQAETIQQLSEAFDQVFSEEEDVLTRRGSIMNKDNMRANIHFVVTDNLDPNKLTRRYGLRQQALYLKEYGVTE